MIDKAEIGNLFNGHVMMSLHKLVSLTNHIQYILSYDLWEIAQMEWLWVTFVSSD